MISLKKEKSGCRWIEVRSAQMWFIRTRKMQSWTNAWQGISCKDRLSVERQPAKYPPANGTREPHGATSRNVEE